MAQLRQSYPDFKKRDTEILVIGPDTSSSFSKFWKKNKLKFIGLPDPEHKVLKLYGQEVNLFKMGRMPAQMLIDKSGCLRYVHYGHSMKDIPTNKEIISQIDQLNTSEN